MNDIEMILRSRIEELERRLLESQARVHAAEAETVEQARLLGMSAERECALRAKLETAEARVKELEVSLAAIGDIAVSNLDDSTVGKVDELLDEPVRYADILRSLFKSADRVKELEADNTRGAAYVQHLTARVKELEAVHPDTERLDWLEKHAGIDPGNCDIRCESIYEVRFPTGHHYYRHEKHKPFRAAIDAIRQQGGAK